jgi:hypothetical protein
VTGTTPNSEATVELVLSDNATIGLPTQPLADGQWFAACVPYALDAVAIDVIAPDGSAPFRHRLHAPYFHPTIGSITDARSGDESAMPATQDSSPMLTAPTTGSGSCVPSESAGADDTVDSGRRVEALVKYLTGIDELVLQAEQEGVDIVYDDPNYGGVWGDGAGGLVVAVIDCDEVDVDRVAQIAGGPAAVQIIEVPYTYEQLNDLRDQLVAELRDLGMAGGVGIDFTPAGRRITVMAGNPDQLPADFGAAIPSDAFTIVQGRDFPEEA